MRIRIFSRAHLYIAMKACSRYISFVWHSLLQPKAPRNIEFAAQRNKLKTPSCWVRTSDKAEFHFTGSLCPGETFITRTKAVYNLNTPCSRPASVRIAISLIDCEFLCSLAGCTRGEGRKKPDRGKERQRAEARNGEEKSRRGAGVAGTVTPRRCSSPRCTLIIFFLR